MLLFIFCLFLNYVNFYFLWSPQVAGAYAVNNELQRSKRLFEGELYGPESFAVDKDGKYYHCSKSYVRNSHS